MNSDKKINGHDKFEYNWDDHEVWNNISISLDRKKRKRRFFIFLYFPIFCILLGSIIFVHNFEKGRALNEQLNYVKRGDPISESDRKGENNILTNENVPQNILERKNIFPNDKNLKQHGFESEKEEKFTKNLNRYFLLQAQVPSLNLVEGIGDNRLMVVTQSDSTSLTAVESNNMSESGIINTLNVENLEDSKFLSTLVDSFKSDTFEKQIEIVHTTTNEVEFTKAYSIQFINAFGIGWKNDQFDPTINWQVLRHRQEKYLYSTTHALTISRILKSNFFLAGGFEIQRFISNLTGANVSTNIVNIYSDSARVQNINGVDHYYGGTIEKTIHRTENFNVFNKYTYFLIPIKFGYFVSKNGTEISFDLGTSFLMGGTHKGYAMDSDSLIKPYSSLNTPLDINKFRFTTLFSSININRRINADLDLSLGIQFQLGVQALASQRVDFERLFSLSYNNFYLSTGLNYRIK